MDEQTAGIAPRLGMDVLTIFLEGCCQLGDVDGWMRVCDLFPNSSSVLNWQLEDPVPSSVPLSYHLVKLYTVF